MSDIDTTIIDFTRKYRIGTRFKTATGGFFQYVKVDFGVAGKIKGKAVRCIQYMWLPRNGAALYDQSICHPRAAELQMLSTPK